MTQLAELFRILLKIWPRMKWILLASIVCGGAVGGYAFFCVRPSYVSEAIALVRPQRAVEIKRTKDEEVQGTSVLPEPLGVTDYVLLLQSDGVLSAVAKAYNQYQINKGLEGRVTAVELKRKLTPMERLQLKTPYAVVYYPTIEMRVTAPSRDMAYDLANLWVNVVQARTEDIAFSGKKQAASYLTEAYQVERGNVISLSDTLNEVMRESGELIDAKKQERLNIEQAYTADALSLLQQASDQWDDRIAQKQAEFNLPLLKAQIESKTRELDGLQVSLARRELDLNRAKAQMDELSQALDGQASRTGDYDTAQWTIRLPEPLQEKEAARRQRVRSRIVEEKVGETPGKEDKGKNPEEMSLREQLQEREVAQREKEAAKAGPKTQQVTEEVTDVPVEPPNLESSERGRLESLTVTSSGQNPIAVLLEQEYLDAQLTVSAAPIEIADLEGREKELIKEIKEIQANYFTNEAAIKILERGKESEIKKIETERGYGLLGVEQRSKVEVNQLTRERNAKEEQHKRDFDTQAETFKGLATSRLQAQLAVANTIAEFQIVSAPTYPDEAGQLQFLFYGAGAFAALFVMLTVLCAVLAVAQEIVGNIRASESGS